MCNRSTTLLVLAASLLVTGCGPGNPLGRLAISGTVEFDGQPLPAGTIRFEPIDGTGTSSGALIQDGQFSIETLKGLPPGEYRVRIMSQGEELAVDPNAVPGPSEAPGPPPPGFTPAVERIPARYNTQSELTRTVSADSTSFEFKLDP